MKNGETAIRRLLTSTLSKGGIARNLIFMTLWQGANYLAPLLTFPHLARTLRPSGFGELGIYLALAGYMTIISDWGTAYTGARQIAQSKALGLRLEVVFWNIFVSRMVTAFVVLAIALGYIVLSACSSAEAALLICAWTIVLGNALTVSWCLQGLERLDGFAMAALFGRLFTVPTTLYLVKEPTQVWLAILLQGIGGVIIGFVSIFLLYRSRVIQHFSFSVKGCIAQFVEGLPIVLSTASHGLYSSSSTMCLGWFQGKAATGVFVTADKLRLAVQGALGPISQTLYPRISRLAVTDRIRAVSIIQRLIIIQLCGMTALSVFVIVAAPLLISLVAGPAFVSSGQVLRILGPCLAFYSLNVALGMQTLLPFGLKRQYGLINTLTAAFNLIIMPLLVYKWSYIGASIGVLMTEFFMLVCYTVVVWRSRVLRGNLVIAERHAA